MPLSPEGCIGPFLAKLPQGREWGPDYFGVDADTRNGAIEYSRNPEDRHALCHKGF